MAQAVNRRIHPWQRSRIPNGRESCPVLAVKGDPTESGQVRSATAGNDGSYALPIFP